GMASSATSGARPATLLAAVAAPCPEAPLAETRRLYDFTPVGAANPALASVDGCWIQIPLAEFRGHLAAELGDDERRGLTLEGRRRQLERLVDEHLILADAYRQGADRSERAVALLDRTRRLLLGESLLALEVDGKAASASEHERLRRRLLDG